jgi:hypothetical protein
MHAAYLNPVISPPAIGFGPAKSPLQISPVSLASAKNTLLMKAGASLMCLPTMSAYRHNGATVLDIPLKFARSPLQRLTRYRLFLCILCFARRLLFCFCLCHLCRNDAFQLVGDLPLHLITLVFEGVCCCFFDELQILAT